MQFDQTLYAYICIDNPLTILIENTNCNSIVLSSKNGTIKHDSINPCKFSYKSFSSITDIITISKIDSNKDTIFIDKRKVYKMPLPFEGYFYGIRENNINKNSLLNFPKSFRVVSINLDIDYELPIDSFSVIIKHDCNLSYKKRLSIHEDLSDLLHQFSILVTGDEIEFYGISYLLNNKKQYITTKLIKHIE